MFVVNFFVAFRTGPLNDEGVYEGATLSFDRNQRSQEADKAIGDVRFSVYKHDLSKDDGKGEEVKITGNYARNMRIMGHRYFCKIQTKKRKPADNPPFSMELLHLWGEAEYCPDKKTFLKKRTQSPRKASEKKKLERSRAKDKVVSAVKSKPTKKRKLKESKKKKSSGSSRESIRRRRWRSTWRQ